MERSLLALIALATVMKARPKALPDSDEDEDIRPQVPFFPKSFAINDVQSDYWIKQAKTAVKEKQAKELNTNIAKNVIMFLGDGMSLSTIKAARVWLGQSKGNDGEATRLAMEDFPYSGFSKTYCLDSQVADSACSATAFLGGVKANRGTVGVNGKVRYHNCMSSLNESNFVYSIGKLLQDIGKKSGVVTTTRVTHATPAGVYAHIADRRWESDYDTSDIACKDIAHQLVHGETGKNLNVILGGGRRNFIPNNLTDEEGSKGRRIDGRNLIKEWLNSKQGEPAEYVWNRSGLLQAADKNNYLLGLFESSHMQYYLDAADNHLEPTLPEMTEVAIKMLSKGENGYFLLVEGGKIDTAHHRNLAHKCLAETVQFSKAIQTAKNLTNEEDTLIVVTADHSHVFTVAGYATRGTNILGIAGRALDNIAYPILSYANGPGYRKEVNGVRYDFSQNNYNQKDFVYPAMIPLFFESHGGEDVGIFTSGPWAHLFTGVMEQNVIPYIMLYASGVRDETERYGNIINGTTSTSDSSRNTNHHNSFVLLFLNVIYLAKSIYKLLIKQWKEALAKLISVTFLNLVIWYFLINF